MKILFFLALLANLTFFFWQYNEGGYAFLKPPVPVLTDTNPKQIQLLAEVKAQPPRKSNKPLLTENLHDHNTTNTAIAVNTPLLNSQVNPPVELETNTAHPIFKQPDPSPETELKKTYCYLVSGFSNKTAIQTWLNKQPATTELGRKIKKNKIVGFDYQVYYPAAANLAQSQKNLTTVKNLGVREVFLIKNKQFAGDISFGIFSEQPRAIAVQSALNKRGIHALIRKRPKIHAITYIRIKTEKNKKQLAASLNTHIHKLAIETASRCY